MKKSEVIFFLVVSPLAVNALLALAAFVVHPEEFTDRILACWLIVGLALVLASTAVFGLKTRDVAPKLVLYTLLAQGVILIVIFAGIYRGYGLLYSGAIQSMLNDGQGALYFSVVTWTTLGYGDFTPPPGLRLIAALEALVGYGFFGVSVGIGTFLLCERRERQVLEGLRWIDGL